MSGVILFGFGFAAGALSIAAVAFFSSLPRDEDWPEADLGVGATIGSCRDSSSRGQLGGRIAGNGGALASFRQPIAWIGPVPCYSAEDIQRALEQ